MGCVCGKIGVFDRVPNPSTNALVLHCQRNRELVASESMHTCLTFSVTALACSVSVCACLSFLSCHPTDVLFPFSLWIDRLTLLLCGPAPPFGNIIIGPMLVNSIQASLIYLNSYMFLFAFEYNFIFSAYTNNDTN